MIGRISKRRLVAPRRLMMPCLGLLVVLGVAMANPVRAEDHDIGANQRREPSGWWWAGFQRHDAYYSAPPMIYPPLGFNQLPARQPAANIRSDVPLFDH